jgi:hypothetical protein
MLGARRANSSACRGLDCGKCVHQRYAQRHVLAKASRTNMGNGRVERKGMCHA